MRIRFHYSGGIVFGVAFDRSLEIIPWSVGLFVGPLWIELEGK